MLVYLSASLPLAAAIPLMVLLTVLLQAVLKSQNLMLYLQKQAHQSLA